MAALFRRSSRPILQCQRTFSTSRPHNVNLQWERNDPEALKNAIPPYPYGPTRWFKQSRSGLYGGQTIQFGNNSAEKNTRKTRRTWKPNIFTRKLFSKALNRTVQVRVSTRVLRTIDKLGGLDEYLLGEKEAQIKSLGESGWWLRWAIMQTPAIRKRFKEERERLGITELSEEVEGLAEEMASTEEVAESLEATEKVGMDDAFQLDETEGARPIKFRVGPGKHIMLTSEGWRRTRPSQTYFAEKRKDALIAKKYSTFVEDKLRVFTEKLEKEQEALLKKNGQKPIREEEKAFLIKMAKKEFEKRMEAKAERQLEIHRRRIERGKENRKKVKQAKAKGY